MTDTRTYDIAAIRRLLTAAFTPQSLRQFCQDRPMFEPILSTCGRNASLSEMIECVIEYCQTQLLWDEFLAEVKRENPRQYERFESESRNEGFEFGLRVPQQPTSIQHTPPTWSAWLLPVGILLLLLLLGLGVWKWVIPALQATPTPVPKADLYIHDLVFDEDDERIIITNRGDAPQGMEGWRIHSVEGDQWYDFPMDFVLDAGVSVYIHACSDADSEPPAHLLWDQTCIWNNEGDKAVLYDDAGLQVSAHCYKDGCP